MPHQDKTYTTNYIPAFQKLAVELMKQRVIMLGWRFLLVIHRYVNTWTETCFGPKGLRWTNQPFLTNPEANSVFCLALIFLLSAKKKSVFYFV